MHTVPAHRMTGGRLLAVALILTAFVAVAAQPAVAETQVEQRRRERRVATDQIRTLLRRSAAEERDLKSRLASLEGARRAAAASGAAGVLDRSAASTRAARGHTAAALRRLQRTVPERLAELRTARDQAEWWLDTYAVLRVCPVPDYTDINNDFGEMVRLPKVPVHRHQGSDVSAPIGAPILAPFDGYAWGSWSRLGGQEVHVRGDRGYVYNAHLSRFGSLGYVDTGDVVGYVGITGDATGPHDHFEWHPWNGGAADPYWYLVLACVDV